MSPILKIRIYGDPVLRRESKEVKTIGPAERMLIASMIETMHEQKGIGLAAPQVGINQKIFVVDVGEGPHVFINPRIIKTQGTAELEEGCLSIPGVNIVVKRPQKVLVRYTDENNQELEGAFDEILARVIQHENDHLNGKMIVDYATKDEMQNFAEHLGKLEQGIIELPEESS